MPKAAKAAITTASVNPIQADAETKEFFIVEQPSAALSKIRELRAAFSRAERASSVANHAHCERALDAAQDAFLSRVPKNGADILEMLEVIASDNLWETIDDDDVPVRFSLFARALKAYASKTDDTSSCRENWWDCEEQLNIIGRATRTLSIIADACGNGAYTSTENVEESLTLIIATLNTARRDLASLLNLPGSKADA